MEQVRTQITILGTMIERYDQLVKDIADTRWVLEMVRLQDQVQGEAKAQAQQKTSGDYEYTVDQLARAERVALKVSGFKDLESLRQHFLALVTAYNAYTDLVEAQQKQLAAGKPFEQTFDLDKAIEVVNQISGNCTISEPSNLLLI